ncbi:MAG: hypothetical protein HKN34_05390 [Gammaproteobacteria bacterium]|nr:hypothetical protein [Gammaproteobacteria bacterium]NNF82517.1 hypothetical protein [Flavobacteriaceae bacterium]
MTDHNSPFRLLSKTRSNQILTREQYVKTRNELLRILLKRGSVSEDDLKKITDSMGDKSQPKVEKSYSSSDWVIIALGLIAALVLGFVLYD